VCFGGEEMIYYIVKGDSNFCTELIYDYETDTMVKDSSCGFYDIVCLEDTVEGGIKVIEYSEYEKLEKQLEDLRALNILTQLEAKK
jgi:hypothetical protein